MDKSAFTIEEHLVSVWVHRKGWSGETCDEMAVTFAHCFKKTAPTEATLHKLERKSQTSPVLDVQ
jgi:hypothetical protein